MALKRAVGFVVDVGSEGGACRQLIVRRRRLTAEAVQGAALAFESVDDVHGGDGLALGVLAVRDSVTDDVLKENLHTRSIVHVSVFRQQQYSP